MSVTEIYSCKPGQKLKEGRLDYSSDVTCKEEAEVDALRRVKIDPSLAKVAYYQVTEDGRFRVIHSYTNPNPSAAKPARPASRSGSGTAAGKTRQPPKKKTMLEKLMGFFR